MLSKHESSPYFLQTWGTFLVLLSGALYGFIGFLGIKILLDRFSLADMLFWRFLIASVWMIFFSTWNKEFASNDWINKSTLINVLFLGSIFYSCSSAFYFLSSQNTGTGPAMVIFFSFPVFVVLFAWLLYREKINKFALSSLAAIVIGLYLLRGTGTSTLNANGIFFGIASALFYAFYVMSSKKQITFLSANILSTLICIGNTLFFLIVAYLTHSLHIPIHSTTWIYLIILGIFATALPIQFLFMGLKYISPIKASILTVTEPVMTLLIGILLLSESISSYQMVGVCVILLGAVLIQFE